MFRKHSFPRVVMNPSGCQPQEFIRGNVELVRLSEAEGRSPLKALPSAGRAVRGPGRSLGRGGAAISWRWKRDQHAARFFT